VDTGIFKRYFPLREIGNDINVLVVGSADLAVVCGLLSASIVVSISKLDIYERSKHYGSYVEYRQNLTSNMLSLLLLLLFRVLASRGLMRGIATLPHCNQELLVVKDKVGRHQRAWVSKSMECDTFSLQCFDTAGWATGTVSSL